MDRVLNAQIRKLFGIKKGLDERIDEGILWWFGHMERTEKDRIFSRSWRRWIDTVKDCLQKKRFGCQACKENSPK